MQKNTQLSKIRMKIIISDMQIKRGHLSGSHGSFRDVQSICLQDTLGPHVEKIFDRKKSIIRLFLY